MEVQQNDVELLEHSQNDRHIKIATRTEIFAFSEQKIHCFLAHSFALSLVTILASHLLVCLVRIRCCLDRVQLFFIYSAGGAAFYVKDAPLRCVQSLSCVFKCVAIQVRALEKKRPGNSENCNNDMPSSRGSCLEQCIDAVNGTESSLLAFVINDWKCFVWARRRRC